MTTAVPIPLAQRRQEQPVMADFTHRIKTTTTHEFPVPVGPYGAPAAEIGKAWAVAEHAYREALQMPADAPLSDNALVFRPGDDEIVISFDISTQQ